MDKLKAANLQDKEAILDRLHDEKISLHDVSCKICDCVRDLFCNDLMSHAEAFLSDRTSSSVKAAGHEQLCERMADSALDDDHRTTLTSISNIASFLHAQSKLDEAEPLLREVFHSRRRILGDDNRDTLSCINKMAGLMQAQGKLEEAE